MAQQNDLVGAIRKLALAGERAGFTVEEMIGLLNTGISVETLLNLICFRLDVSDYLTSHDKEHIRMNPRVIGMCQDQ